MAGFLSGGFMARPKKIGLDYFPMDCTWDEKMQGLELIHQNNGIVWIVKFWQRAYQTETGEVDFSGLFGVIQANNCRITIEEHQKIIDTCLQLELLYKTESGLYTSNGIKKRIGAVSKERSDAIERKKFPSLSEDKEEKESKVKETPHCSANNSEQLPNNEMIPLPNSETIPLQEIVPAKKIRVEILVPEEIKESFLKYIDSRKKLKKPMTEHAIDLSIKKISKMGDYKKQNAIIEQSITRGYTDFYPISEPRPQFQIQQSNHPMYQRLT